MEPTASMPGQERCVQEQTRSGGGSESPNPNADPSGRFTLGDAGDRSVSHGAACAAVIRQNVSTSPFGSPGWRLSFTNPADGSDEGGDPGGAGVVLPTFDANGRLSDLLSDSRGAATRLSKSIYAVMIGYAFIWLFFGPSGPNSGITGLLGCRRLNHHSQTCHAESTATAVDVTIHLTKFMFFLVAGPAAFHSLRCVHRPRGELALLRESCGHSTVESKRWLELWGWVIRVLGAVSTGGLLVGAVVAGGLHERWWVALMCVGVAAAVAATTGWWLSMMLGAALVQTPVDRVCEQIRSLDLPLDPTEWEEIERSALRLTSTSLPLLSSGWGSSLGLVGLSYTGLAVAGGIAAFHDDGRSLVTNALTVAGGSRWVVAMFLMAFGPFPLLMAAAPAEVSSACDRLLASLVAVMAADPLAQKPVRTLYKTLRLANREQGVGFKVFGTVIDRRTLGKIALKLYAAVVVIAPLLLHSSSTPENLGAATAGFSCPTGWQDMLGTDIGMDPKCVRLFDDPVEWSVAQSTCSAHGAHLAKVISDGENHHAAHYLEGAGVSSAWIGLRLRADDAAWTDGSHLGAYTSWDTGEPNLLHQDNCVTIFSYGGWADGTKCTERKPFLCILPATRSSANGGRQLGCEGGHWQIGFAHSSPGLPLTVVCTVLPPALSLWSFNLLLLLPSSLRAVF